MLNKSKRIDFSPSVCEPVQSIEPVVDGRRSKEWSIEFCLALAVHLQYYLFLLQYHAPRPVLLTAASLNLSSLHMNNLHCMTPENTKVDRILWSAIHAPGDSFDSTEVERHPALLNYLREGGPVKHLARLNKTQSIEEIKELDATRDPVIARRCPNLAPLLETPLKHFQACILDPLDSWLKEVSDKTNSSGISIPSISRRYRSYSHYRTNRSESKTPKPQEATIETLISTDCSSTAQEHQAPESADAADQIPIGNTNETASTMGKKKQQNGHQGRDKPNKKKKDTRSKRPVKDNNEAEAPTAGLVIQPTTLPDNQSPTGTAETTKSDTPRETPQQAERNGKHLDRVISASFDRDRMRMVKHQERQRAQTADIQASQGNSQGISQKPGTPYHPNSRSPIVVIPKQNEKSKDTPTKLHKSILKNTANTATPRYVATSATLSARQKSVPIKLESSSRLNTPLARKGPWGRLTSIKHIEGFGSSPKSPIVIEKGSSDSSESSDGESSDTATSEPLAMMSQRNTSISELASTPSKRATTQTEKLGVKETTSDSNVRSGLRKRSGSVNYAKFPSLGDSDSEQDGGSKHHISPSPKRRNSILQTQRDVIPRKLKEEAVLIKKEKSEYDRLLGTKLVKPGESALPKDNSIINLSSDSGSDAGSNQDEESSDSRQSVIALPPKVPATAPQVDQSQNTNSKPAVTIKSLKRPNSAAVASQITTDHEHDQQQRPSKRAKTAKGNQTTQQMIPRQQAPVDFVSIVSDVSKMKSEMDQMKMTILALSTELAHFKKKKSEGPAEMDEDFMKGPWILSRLPAEE